MNNLAPVLAQIQEALAVQGEKVKTWTEGALIIVKSDEKGAETAYVRFDSIENVLTPEAHELLAEEDLLVNEGKRVMQRGKTGRFYALGIHLSELRNRVRKAMAEASHVQVLKRRCTQLERELRVARESNASELAMTDLLHSLAEVYAGRGRLVKPVKFNKTKPTKGLSLAGIPTIMCSDWHWGEVVDPAQINYLNEYNLEIANRRADRVFGTAQELLFHHQAGQSYDGVTVILAGDMFSGNIHEELRMTNDQPILECVLGLSEVLARHIVSLAQNFAWVYVPCVPGNHGRIDRKPTAKMAVKDNFDWILYHMVKSHVQGSLGDRCNVEFDISDSLDMRYDLYGTRYLLTHGDQIKGGSGIGGFWPSMFKMTMKKQQREVQSGGRGFDYMVCGHFHKYGAVSNVIVNGSLKGYDEWVYRMNFENEPAIQAMWTTHPEYGIIDRRPLFADGPVRDLRSDAAPVTTYRTGLRAAA